ncbi:biopolymer transporter ExbD [Verrucomicrobiaceae bacterium R5-34]|nr:biopolymer transporter ExbD [Verrucomicrobiaceae bacterium R5-34]
MRRTYHAPAQASAHESDEPRLDISSLIDVCFLLLIYFLVTTTIRPREQDLSTHIPFPSDHHRAVILPMVIEIKQDGGVVVNPGDAAEIVESDPDSRKLPLLSDRLQILTSLGRADQPKVLLKVHDSVQQQRYIDVINCLAGAGIKDIALVD